MDEESDGDLSSVETGLSTSRQDDSDSDTVTIVSPQDTSVAFSASRNDGTEGETPIINTHPLSPFHQNSFQGFKGPFSRETPDIRMVAGEPYDPEFPTPAQRKEIKDRKGKRSATKSDSEPDDSPDETKRSRPRRSSSTDSESRNLQLNNITHPEIQICKPLHGLDSTQVPDIDLKNIPSTTDLNQKESSKPATSPVDSNFSTEVENKEMEDLQVITICIRTYDNSRVFNNPLKVEKLLKNWKFNNYIIPNSRVIPGSGNSLILQIKLTEQIARTILFSESFQLSDLKVRARKMDNPDVNINYVKIGPFGNDVSLEEILGDINTDNDSYIDHLSWIGGTNKTRSFGRYVKVKLLGDITKYITVYHCRYTPYPFAIPMLRCNNCSDLGHSDIRCTHQPRCSVCGGKHNTYAGTSTTERQLCAKTPKCFQCKGLHRATSNLCPKNIEAMNLHKNLLKSNTPLKEINRKLRELNSKSWSNDFMNNSDNMRPINNPGNNIVQSNNIFENLTEFNIDQVQDPSQALTPELSQANSTAESSPTTTKNHFQSGTKNPEGAIAQSTSRRTTGGRKEEGNNKGLHQKDKEQEKMNQRQQTNKFTPQPSQHTSLPSPQEGTRSFPPTKFQVPPPQSPFPIPLLSTPFPNPNPNPQPLISPLLSFPPADAQPGMPPPPPQHHHQQQQQEQQQQHQQQHLTTGQSHQQPINQVGKPTFQSLIIEAFTLFMQGETLIQILKVLLPKIEILLTKN